MLKEYNVEQDVMTLYCDNLSAINISKNPVQHSRTAEYAANQNNNVSDQHSRPHSSTGLVRERRIKKKIELLFKKNKRTTKNEW